MFASSPAVSALEHPVYDLWVTGCADPVAPPPEGTPDAAKGAAPPATAGAGQGSRPADTAGGQGSPPQADQGVEESTAPRSE
jgi:hypothetical protein